MLFDTDILIWVQRGNSKAAQFIDGADERLVSILTYMELLQAAKDKRQHAVIKQYVRDLSFSILPLTEGVGHRALVYVEEYGLSSGMRAGDAIVAATATENGLTLATGNARHFRPIKDLSLKIFRP
jgi:hypothetical protein